MIVKAGICFLVSLSVTVLISPLVIFLSKKMKFGQTILHYVDFHSGKQGTPTMGGFVFIIPIILVSPFFFTKNFSLGLVTLATTVGFALLGFLDDYIKIKYKQNEGLKPYQKIIGQVGLSLIVAIFAFKSELIGSEILVPFSDKTINLSWGIIVFIVFIFIALVNSVNLTDGLDGLATGVSTGYLLGFSAVFTIILSATNLSSLSGEYQTLLMICFASIGALVGFILFNCFPAKIFMGDTGSLAIGGLLSSLAVFSRTELFIPLLGIMFVLSALSDVIQVIHFKRTKKRVFLMAPLHHHFEKKGVNENRITAIYIVVTIAVSILVTILQFQFF